MEFMFEKPENHVVIAVTKAHLFPDLFDAEEVMDMAEGKNNEMVSFRGYKIQLI